MKIKKIKKFAVNIKYQGFAFCFLAAAISNNSLLYFNLFLGLILASLICYKLRGFPKYRVYAELLRDIGVMCLGFFLVGISTIQPHNIFWLFGSVIAYYYAYLIEKSYGD